MNSVFRTPQIRGKCGLRRFHWVHEVLPCSLQIATIFEECCVIAVFLVLSWYDGPCGRILSDRFPREAVSVAETAGDEKGVTKATPDLEPVQMPNMP